MRFVGSNVADNRVAMIDTDTEAELGHPPRPPVFI